MLKVLLTGASGYLGRYLLRLQPADTMLLAIYNRQALTIEDSNIQVLQQDLLHIDFQKWAEFAPDVIIHAAAQSRFHACQEDPDGTWKANVGLTEKITRFASEHNVHLIFTSTGQVYREDVGPHSENDKTEPKNVYAESKLAAEKTIIKILPDATILRCALMYGTSLNNNPVFTDLMAQKLKAGEHLDLFADEWRSPIWVADLADMIWQLVEKKPRGVFNAGGSQRLSRFDMGKIMCDVLQLPHSRLRNELLADHPLAPLRPADCSMDSRKLNLLLGRVPRLMAEAFALDEAM